MTSSYATPLLWTAQPVRPQVALTHAEYAQALSAFVAASNEHQIITNWVLRNLDFYLPFHRSLAIMSVDASPQLNCLLAESLRQSGYCLRYQADFNCDLHPGTVEDKTQLKFDFVLCNRCLSHTECLDALLAKLSNNLYTSGFLVSIDDAGDSISPEPQLLSSTELHEALRERGFCFHTEMLATEVNVSDCILHPQLQQAKSLLRFLARRKIDQSLDDWTAALETLKKHIITDNQTFTLPHPLIVTCIVGRRSTTQFTAQHQSCRMADRKE